MLLCGELTCIRWGARVRINVQTDCHRNLLYIAQANYATWTWIGYVQIIWMILVCRF